MDKAKEINIAVKFAEIDNQPYSGGDAGWVSGLVAILAQSLAFYFDRPFNIILKKETELITEQEFEALDSVIYILSPAFRMSSNIAAEISAIEKALLFNTDYLNSKIHKILKGPVEVKELPATISMGTFHYFYQTGSEGGSSYETLFSGDNAADSRRKYWDSFTNLLFDLLKNLKHSHSAHFTPESGQTIFLGPGDVGQLWNRSHLFGELISRGVKVLPDHDYSIEVKHLNEPIKFYLKKSDFAICFPEDYIPPEKDKIKELEDLTWLKRYIWFDPEAEKEPVKKKQYDELKQKLKNLDHVEAISSGLEELKEIIFAASQKKQEQQKEQENEENNPVLPELYLIVSDEFPEEGKEKILHYLNGLNVQLLLAGKEKVQEKRAIHYQNLQNAAYCLICYDGNNPEWLRANVNEVKKSAGFSPESSQRTKIGIIAGGGEIPDGVPDYQNTYSVISSLSPTLEEDLKAYLNGR